MFELSNRERNAVSKELKDFAFEQSPLFKRDLTQGMEVRQYHEIHDDWSEFRPAQTRESSEFMHNRYEDVTSVEIGFDATREKYGGILQGYLFRARLITSQYVQPHELMLGDQDWVDIGTAYGEEDDSDEGFDKRRIMHLLTESMTTCERYRRVDYTYDTREGIISVNDERGYLLDGTPFNAIESHPHHTTHDQTNDSLDETLTGDQLLTHLQFGDVTSKLQEEYDENGNIMPHADKLRELRYLVQCLKNRVIDIR